MTISDKIKRIKIITVYIILVCTCPCLPHASVAMQTECRSQIIKRPPQYRKCVISKAQSPLICVERSGEVRKGMLGRVQATASL